MKENRARSIIKSLSWRVTATCATIIISYILTRKITLALEIGFFEMITKILIYYLHERLWGKIKFGMSEAKKD